MGIIATVISLIAFVMCQKSSAQDAYPFYSPVDSIIYLQFIAPEVQDEDYITLRIRDEGSRIERTEEYVPGLITTSVRTPGWIFTKKGYASGPDELFMSQDYGETWEISNGPHYLRQNYIWDGKTGENIGQSSIHTGGWLFYTQDSWVTYDSLLALPPDSLAGLELSYTNGLVYSITRYERKISVSSDSGQTWGIGHVNPMQANAAVPFPGAPDELWGENPNPRYFYMLSDTGGTTDSIFTTNLPWRPSQWRKHLIPTGEPGEIYVLAAFTAATYLSLELVVYHVQDYGASVDSFYYYLPNFEIQSNSEQASITTSFVGSCYPNPFNASTTISFDLDHPGMVRLKVFDITGRAVSSLIEESMTAGTHDVLFDGAGLASGIYFYSLQSENQHQTKKMVLLK